MPWLGVWRELWSTHRWPRYWAFAIGLSMCPSRTKERLNTWWPTRNTITKSAILRNRGCDRIGQAYPLRALGGQLDWEERHAKATYVESQKSRVSQPDPLCSIDSNARQTQPMGPNVNMRSGSLTKERGVFIAQLPS